VEGLKSKLKLINIVPADLENGKIKNTINIYSPITGYVTQVNVNVGSYVNPTDVLFKIVDTKHLHAEIIVYEKDVSKIKIGQRVRIQLANENTERIATVYLVGKEIGSDRTIRVHGHLEKEDTQLLPGMYLSALFESGAGSVLSLPEQAIINYEGKDYIFIVRDNEERAYEMVEINIGVNESGFQEVELPAHEDVNGQIVIEGAYDLLSYLKNSEEGEGH
jgi:cobalt-zinc-cadmium efflux system membrane fusion protein